MLNDLLLFISTKLNNADTSEQVLEFIKSEIKQYPNCLSLVLNEIYSNIKKNQAQIRHSCVILIRYLFEKSHKFRLLIVESLLFFTTHTILEIPKNQPFTENLKQIGLETMKDWNSRYSQVYKPIGIAFNHLKDSGISFDHDSIYFTQIDSRSERLNALSLDKFNKIKSDVQNLSEIIKENITKIIECREILIPKFINNEIHTAKTSDSISDTIKTASLGSRHYRLDLNITAQEIQSFVIPEDESNTIVYDNLRGSRKVLLKYLDKAKEFISYVSKISFETGSSNEIDKSNLVKELLVLKGRIEVAIDATNDFALERKDLIPEDEDEFQDEDFVAAEDGLNDVSDIVAENVDDTMPINETPSISFIKELIEPVKLIDFEDKNSEHSDQDDYDETSMFNTGFEISHRGWVRPDNYESKRNSSRNPKRIKTPPTIPAPEFIQQCGAMGSNGIICSRKDLEKCPFHGLKIPRNEYGIPLDPEMAEIEANEISNAKPLWQIIESDVAGAIGLDKKKRRMSNIVPIKKNTPRQNLEAKIKRRR